MTQEELMIGDLVSYKNKMPCKITAMCKDVAVVDNDTGQDWRIDYDKLTPIPLTAEILKKNGFIIKEKWAQIGNFGDSPLIMWHFADDPILRDYKTELEVHQNDTGKVHIHVPCEYVHELQHVLRLCNIDKEIEL